MALLYFIVNCTTSCRRLDAKNVGFGGGDLFSPSSLRVTDARKDAKSKDGASPLWMVEFEHDIQWITWELKHQKLI